jgi:hypothetical protein
MDKYYIYYGLSDETMGLLKTDLSQVFLIFDIILWIDTYIFVSTQNFMYISNLASLLPR